MAPTRIESFVADSAERGVRLDRVLATRLSAFSRTRLKQLILGGHVRVGGKTEGDPEYRVRPGDAIEVSVPPPEPARPEAESIPLTVVYEDDDVIVVDKPAGLVVHPASGNKRGTLVNALIAHCGDSLSGIGGEKRPGIVHRLDKDTSGLLVVAKNDRAHRALAGQFADRGRAGSLKRAYLALVWGVPSPPRGTIDAPIGRDPRSRVKMAVRVGGRRALTRYAVREVYPAEGKPIASLVECSLETGRTHQIRLHLAHIGHPLVGDPVYGMGFRTKASALPPKIRAPLEGLNRQALHAFSLGFAHPLSGKPLAFRSRMPADFASVIKALKTM
jgi:23S rRNA pseudouridine1911/1915/1917 synthase